MSTPIDNLTLGNRIKILRTLHGWTQQDCSNMAKNSRSQWSDWEREDRYPTERNKELIQSILIGSVDLVVWNGKHIRNWLLNG